jgi:hypothetical protein
LGAASQEKSFFFFHFALSSNLLEVCYRVPSARSKNELRQNQVLKGSLSFLFIQLANFNIWIYSFSILFLESFKMVSEKGDFQKESQV